MPGSVKHLHQVLLRQSYGEVCRRPQERVRVPPERYADYLPLGPRGAINCDTPAVGRSPRDRRKNREGRNLLRPFVARLRRMGDYGKICAPLQERRLAVKLQKEIVLGGGGVS